MRPAHVSRWKTSPEAETMAFGIDTLVVEIFLGKLSVNGYRTHEKTVVFSWLSAN